MSVCAQAEHLHLSGQGQSFYIEVCGSWKLERILNNVLHVENSKGCKNIKTSMGNIKRPLEMFLFGFTMCLNKLIGINVMYISNSGNAIWGK